MAYLNDIVTGIDLELRSRLTAFPKSYFAGLVSQIARIKDKQYEYLPAQVLDSGDAKFITVDDVMDLTTYHRISTSSYTQVRNQSYGDGYDSFQHNYEVDLVVLANRKKVLVTPDVLEAAISSNIPLTVSAPDHIEFQNILPVSANHNSRSVFGQEFVGLPYFLKPEHILFSIRYRVELRYRKGCISLCQCNDI